MNKLIAFCAIVAVASLASVESAHLEDAEDGLKRSGPVDAKLDDGFTQFALFEADHIEAGNLPDERKVFAPYCRQTRDKTKEMLKERLVGESLRAFDLLFKADISPENDIDPDEITPDEVEKVAEITRMAIKAADVPDHEETIDEKVQAVEEQFSLMFTLRNVATNIIEQAIASISTEVAKRLEHLKAQFTQEQIMDYVEETCDFVSDIKLESQRKLTEFKNQMLSSPEARKLPRAESRALSAVRVEDLNCVTTTRITTIAKFCLVLPAVRKFYV